MDQDSCMVSARCDWVDTIARCLSDTLLIALDMVVTESLSGIALRLDDNDSCPLVPSREVGGTVRGYFIVAFYQFRQFFPRGAPDLGIRLSGVTNTGQCPRVC